MKKFLFIEGTDPADDTKPAGFTKKGLITVIIIASVLLIFSYFILKNNAVDNYIVPILAAAGSIVVVIVLFYFVVLPLALRLNKKIAQSRNPKYIAWIITIILIVATLVWNFF